MEQQVQMQIVIDKPLPGVRYALQKGGGANAVTVQTQVSADVSLLFTFDVKVKMTNEAADFFGPYVQGSKGQRFVYIGIGTYAGDINSVWSRRLKVPLSGLSIGMINEMVVNPLLVLQATVPGRAADGSPTCATVKNFAGWQVVAGV